jgi:hypothetical protein
MDLPSPESSSGKHRRRFDGFGRSAMIYAKIEIRCKLGKVRRKLANPAPLLRGTWPIF